MFHETDRKHPHHHQECGEVSGQESSASHSPDVRVVAGGTNNAAPKLTSATSQRSKEVNHDKEQRSVEELLNFIEGPDTKKDSNKKQAKNKRKKVTKNTNIPNGEDRSKKVEASKVISNVATTNSTTVPTSTCTRTSALMNSEKAGDIIAALQTAVEATVDSDGGNSLDSSSTVNKKKKKNKKKSSKAAKPTPSKNNQGQDVNDIEAERRRKKEQRATEREEAEEASYYERLATELEKANAQLDPNMAKRIANDIAIGNRERRDSMKTLDSSDPSEQDCSANSGMLLTFGSQDETISVNGAEEEEVDVECLSGVTPTTGSMQHEIDGIGPTTYTLDMTKTYYHGEEVDEDITGLQLGLDVPTTLEALPSEELNKRRCTPRGCYLQETTDETCKVDKM